MTTLEKLQKAEADRPRSYTEFDLLSGPEFAELIAEKLKLDAQKKTAEERLKVLGPEIEAMLAASEVEKVALEDGFVVNRRGGTSQSSISATKLLAAGVSMQTIADCTNEGTPYTFIVITNPEKEAATRAAKPKKAGR